MSNIQSVLAEAAQLSVGDRLQLIEALWDTLPQGQMPPLSDEWNREIKQRLAEFDAGTVEPIPWSEILTNALQRLDSKER